MTGELLFGFSLLMSLQKKTELTSFLVGDVLCRHVSFGWYECLRLPSHDMMTMRHHELDRVWRNRLPRCAIRTVDGWNMIVQ